MKSEGTLPLLNLPVGFAPLKSFPYGGKLHFIKVLIWLLFPVSTIESPNTKTAGTWPVSFLGSIMAHPSLRKNIMTKKIMNEVEKTEFPGWKFILIYENLLSSSSLQGKTRRENSERPNFFLENQW